MPTILLRVRPGEENERGPLYMESAVAALHSLSGAEAVVGLEVGNADGKVALFVRAAEGAAELIESQIYAQYPDTDIERVHEDPFHVGEQEEVWSTELKLSSPEIFPIKRHPQFDDLLTRANMDPLAGITSSLARYAAAGMRGHIQVVLRPLKGSFRRRALRFLPLLGKGLPSISVRYASFFARVQLSRGWRRALYFPIMILMGGFRAWPGFAKFQAAAWGDGGTFTENEEERRVSARSHDREDAVSGARDKVNRLLFLCNVRVSVIVPKGKEREARRKVQEIVGSLRQFSLPQSNEFTEGKITHAQELPVGWKGSPYILSVEEIATIWHVPTILVQTSGIDRVASKKLEPPVNLPVIGGMKEGGLTLLGEAVFHGTRTRFGIKTDDRRRHMYAIGKTGMGKSTLLENMICDDIRAGKGVGVIDPHGDLIDGVLKSIPASRSNDVVLFEPADRDFPISFNPLECRDPDQRPLVTSGLMSVFTKLWPEAFSGRMEHILRNTLLALLEFSGSSMLGIMRMFADPSYREKVVNQVTDPMVKSFWNDEYASWSDKYRTEAVAAIQNKIGQLLSTPMIRNIVGQVKSQLDIREAMDTGKILLVNLSKGKLGEDTSAFLGSMLVTKFQIDAMSRADIPENERKDFYLYVDEFQNFATESFADILSEARKYRLCLTMANQYVSQLIVGERSTRLRDAVFGNVGTLACFQVGSDDAEALSLQFEEAVTTNDILSLPKYHAYVRLMIEGVPSKPFSVLMLPPPVWKEDIKRTALIRTLSRERYAEKRLIVEEKITRWAAGVAQAAETARTVEKNKEKEEEELKKARKKGMKLADYRAWRDREMWTNEFNALRKKKILGEALNNDDEKNWKDLESKLEKSGGIPPLSKGLQELKDGQKK
ncbi:type IV secretory system conjugative DNA transfer family protein [Candidatus Peregrinibacteria bacterium]|nr:type IV secretory system conjugative DNA transfer family protein [Candidatus Peregrinibacteria bacterium]